MQQRVFRQVALERLSSPDQLDRLMRITDAKGWLSLMALLGLTLSLVLWGIFGSVATAVSGEGVLVREGGTYRIHAETPGHVVSVPVSRGQTVAADQVLAVIESSDGLPVELRSSDSFKVLEVLVDPWSHVQPGQPILSVDFPDRPLLAVLYLPADVGQQVRPGMSAQISPVAVKREEFGYMLGRVKSVAQFPATQLGMMALLENESLVERLYAAGGGSPLEVQIQLEPAPTTSSRDDWAMPVGDFSWSSSKKPPISIRGGLLATAEITLSEQRPISLVFPTFR